MDFHNLVWKIFSETPIHQQIAREKQINKGQNNVLTGYPGFDSLLIVRTPLFSLETQAMSLKVIWAPHHSMNELNQVSNFLK
jgi:hypothetical protein